MSLTDPAQQALDDARMTELALAAGGIRRPGQSPDPSPTVLALAQALATVDEEGWVFTSTTKSETSARIASHYIAKADAVLAILPGQTEAEVLQPIRDALANHPQACEESEHCGWKNAIRDVQAALDREAGE